MSRKFDDVNESLLINVKIVEYVREIITSLNNP